MLPNVQVNLLAAAEQTRVRVSVRVRLRVMIMVRVMVRVMWSGSW